MNVMVTTTWIPVSQELPDDEITVLIYGPQLDPPVWLGFRDGDEWRDVDGGLSNAPITHWADLPDPPEVGV